MSREDPMKVLMAAAVGFAAGLLFAPRSGQETREQLRHQAEDAKQKAREVTDNVKHKTESGREKARTVSDKVRNRGKQAKQDVDEEIDATRQQENDL